MPLSGLVRIQHCHDVVKITVKNINVYWGLALEVKSSKFMDLRNRNDFLNRTNVATQLDFLYAVLLFKFTNEQQTMCIKTL